MSTETHNPKNTNSDIEKGELRAYTTEEKDRIKKPWFPTSYPSGKEPTTERYYPEAPGHPSVDEQRKLRTRKRAAEKEKRKAQHRSNKSQNKTKSSEITKAKLRKGSRGISLRFAIKTIAAIPLAIILLTWIDSLTRHLFLEKNSGYPKVATVGYEYQKGSITFFKNSTDYSFSKTPAPEPFTMIREPLGEVETLTYRKTNIPGVAPKGSEFTMPFWLISVIYGFLWALLIFGWNSTHHKNTKLQSA